MKGCCITTCIYKYMQKQSTDNIRTSMNELTHFFIKIYLSHFILERAMFVVCERWFGDGHRLLYYPKFIFDHSSTSFSSWLGCSTAGHWGPQNPQSASWFSRWHPLSSWLEPPQATGYIIVKRPPASAVLPLIYTGASVDWRLGRGSIYNRGAPYSPKLQHHWNHTIRLFSIISRTFVMRVLPPCRDAVGVFFSMNNNLLPKYTVFINVYIYIYIYVCMYVCMYVCVRVC